MLLRRVLEHVKQQNWFAVTLDFVIVVIGVGVALAAGEWMNARAAKADLKRAEITMHSELYSNYLNALERLAVRDCIADQIHQIGERLEAMDEPWVPLDPNPIGGTMAGTLGTVLRAPYRGWPSIAWTAASESGLLIHMEPERRDALSEIFFISETLGAHENSIFQKQAELKALMIATELSAADRLRYFDSLAEIDAASALIEVGAQFIIAGVESLDISLTPEFEQQFQANLESRNRLGPQVYGDCFGPMIRR